MVRNQWRTPASMRDAQGELAARQSHLPKIRDDRKSVDRDEQIGVRSCFDITGALIHLTIWLRPRFILIRAETTMKGKVAVITGALGALGKVVAEEALSRGPRVAGIDHAASQLAATAERIELGRIDLHRQAGHVTAPDQCCKTSESSCQG